MMAATSTSVIRKGENMSIWQAILLGTLQGATEFLPVSSSGHLVIVPYLLHWAEPGLVFDTVVHLGTLLAIVLYFWDDLWQLFLAALDSLKRRSLVDANARLAWEVALGSLPAVIVGVLFNDLFETLFGKPRAAAGFLLVTAGLLLLAEFVGKRDRPLLAVSWLDALIIGTAQAFAITPGISRSGSTIAAGMMLGLRREDAARFSFLLAVPIIFGSGMYQVLKTLHAGWGGTPIAPLVAGFLAAFIVGYLAVSALLMYIRKHSLWPFALYCATFGELVLSGILS